MAGVSRVRVPLCVSLAVAVVCAGCASSGLDEISHAYYGAGPKDAVEAARAQELSDRVAHLAAMEEAVALQELGHYEESNELLARCARQLEELGSDAGGSMFSLLANDEAKVYRGEYFERVYLHTLSMTNFLALQDVDDAAEEGVRALESIAAAACEGCRFPFTRYLAALALELSGSPERALEVLAEAVAESPGDTFLEGELDRLAAGRPPRGAPGFAPPPLPDEPEPRVLYVVLLLGAGPQKVEDAVAVPWSHAVAWPRYEPRWPPTVSAARLRLDDGQECESVRLTDMLELARASLRARRGGLLAKEVGKTVGQEVVAQEVGESHGVELEFLVRVLFSLGDRADLRHWSTLPSSCHIIKMPVPDHVTACELVYTYPAGEEAEREQVPLPEAWQEGPLFITRRVP